jgi:hypothetical protein
MSACVTRICRITLLRLHSNNLTGSIPDTWNVPEASSYTLDLDLGFNQLTGTLPDSWGAGLVLGSYVNLENNMLTGEQCTTPST